MKQNNDETSPDDERLVKLSPHDAEHIGEILSGYGTWFTAKLIRLVATADEDSKRQIMKGFPDVVNAVHQFQTGEPFFVFTEKDDVKTLVERDGMTEDEASDFIDYNNT